MPTTMMLIFGCKFEAQITEVEQETIDAMVVFVEVHVSN